MTSRTPRRGASPIRLLQYTAFVSTLDRFAMPPMLLAIAHSRDVTLSKEVSYSADATIHVDRGPWTVDLHGFYVDYDNFIDLLPTADAHILPDCGHLGMIEHSEQFNAVVENLLARVRALL